MCNELKQVGLKDPVYHTNRELMNVKALCVEARRR